MYAFFSLLNIDRDLNIDYVNQSIRIIANLIAAGVHQSSTALDDMISVLLEFTNFIVKLKLSDAHGLIIKVSAKFKNLLVCCESSFLLMFYSYLIG